MGRVRIDIDRVILTAAINNVEGGDSPPSNLNDLYIRVSKLLGVSTGAVKGRIEDYEIPLKTPKGRRGRLPGVKVISREAREARDLEDSEDSQDSTDAGDDDSLPMTKWFVKLDVTSFYRVGVKISSLYDFIVSPKRTDEQNFAILDVMDDLREHSGLRRWNAQEFKEFNERYAHHKSKQVRAYRPFVKPKEVDDVTVPE